MKTLNTSIAVLSFAALFATSASANLGRYRVIDLGQMGGVHNSAVGINNNGLVVGNMTDATGLVRAWQYNLNTKQLIVLPRPSDFTNTRVRDINDSGRMVGYGTKVMSPSSRSRGLYWSDPSMPVQITPFDGTTNADSYLMGINNNGNCVGAASGRVYSGTATSVLQGMSYYAPNNAKTFRGTLGNINGTSANTSFINAINSTEVCVGYTRTTSSDNAGMRDNGSGGMFSVANPYSSSSSTSVEDINDFNRMVGTFWPATGQSRAFYKDNYGTTTLIPQLSYTQSGDSSAARSVNNLGYIAGNNETGTTLRGTLFDGTTLTDLNVISDGQMFNYIGSANDINEKMCIAGDLGPSGTSRACVLLPVQNIQVPCTFEDTQLSGYVEWDILSTAGAVVDSGSDIPVGGVLRVSTIHSGIGTLRIKPSHWLQRNVVFNATTVFQTINTAPTTFKNGDVNNDNVVDIADYTGLAAAFDSVYGGPNWNFMADLNADQIVDIADYVILARNFDMFGD